MRKENLVMGGLNHYVQRELTKVRWKPFLLGLGLWFHDGMLVWRLQYQGSKSLTPKKGGKVEEGKERDKGERRG